MERSSTRDGGTRSEVPDGARAVDDDSQDDGPDADEDDDSAAKLDAAAVGGADAGQSLGAQASDAGRTQPGVREAGASPTPVEDTGARVVDASATPSVEAGGDSPAPPACDCTDCTEEAVSVLSALHVSGPIDYGADAPAGGDHASCWGRWGVHDVPLPPENFVHNLEHGGVALLYHCPDGCAEDVRALEEFAANHELTVLTAYPGMTHRFAVTSWGYRLQMDCLDLQRVGEFYELHVDRAPERFGRPPPEPPASCE